MAKKRLQNIHGLQDAGSEVLDSRLADRARADAMRVTPGFSETLHCRVVQTINQMEVRNEAAPWIPGQRQFRPRAIPLAVAAAVAVALIPSLFLVTKSTTPVVVVRPPVRAHPAAVPAVRRPTIAIYAAAHEVNFKVQNAVQTALVHEQYAGLDHDFRAATQYFVEQVPLRSVWESAPPDQARQ